MVRKLFLQHRELTIKTSGRSKLRRFFRRYVFAMNLIYAKNNSNLDTNSYGLS